MFARLLSSWITLLVLVVIIVGGAMIVSSKYSALKQEKEEAAVLDERVREAEEDLEAKRAQAEYFASDDYKERQARIKLNYKKPGEKVVYVYRDVASSSSDILGITNEATEQGESSSWKLWFDFALGR